MKAEQTVEQLHSTAGLIPNRLRHVEEHGVPGKIVAADIDGLSGPLEVGRVGLVFHIDTRQFATTLTHRYNSFSLLRSALLRITEGSDTATMREWAHDALNKTQDYKVAISTKSRVSSSN